MLRTEEQPQDEGFTDAIEAFKALLDESIIRAIASDQRLSMNVLEAIIDGFREQGAFSWVKTLKILAALSVGSLASLFSVTAAATGAAAIEKALKETTGWNVSNKDILTRFFQATNTSASAALGIYCCLNLINVFFANQSKAEKYLEYRSATTKEKIQKFGVLTGECALSIITNVFTFFYARSINIYVAFPITLSNAIISWLGIHLADVAPAKIHPARKIEVDYINEQIETFLKLPFEQQNNILDELAAFKQQHAQDRNLHKKIYARLLTLTRVVLASEQLSLQQPSPESTFEKMVAHALATYITIGQINYSESTYAGINGLFANSSSPLAITSASLLALASLPCNTSLGYMTGLNAARAGMSDKVPLAELYNAKLRAALKYIIFLIGIFTGPTCLAVSLIASGDYSTLMKLKETLQRILTISNGTISYSGACIIDSYYALRLCDEVLIYIAQRCGNAQVQRLFTFVLEARKISTCY